MLSELRKGVWNELATPNNSTDVYRRNLQRAYLEILGNKLNPSSAPTPAAQPSSPLPGEARALIRGELMDLDAAISSALPRAANRETRLHLQDSRYQISRILYPEKKGKD
jgi:hypothetical protein